MPLREMIPFLAAALVVAAQAAPAGRTVAVNGIEMYYEAQGEGRPLVLLHGFNASGEVWRAFIPEFAKSFRVIVPDLRGHGRSTNPTNEFTHRQSARDIHALLDHLGITEFEAMGISSGGMTLLHMAAQQPARIKSMVLIGATTYFPEQARAIMRTRTPDSLKPEELERLRRVHKHGDEQIRALRAQFLRFKDSYEDMSFTPPQLATINARTLIIHGDRDEFFPVSIPLEMYRSIPKSFLWIVPNGTHVPIHQHPEEFMRVALDFLGTKQ